MAFAQRRNLLTTHFSERIPVVKRRISVLPKFVLVHYMTFAQRRNRLTTHFSERIPIVKRRTSAQTQKNMSRSRNCCCFTNLQLDVFQTDRKRMTDKDRERNCYERNSLCTPSTFFYTEEMSHGIAAKERERGKHVFVCLSFIMYLTFFLLDSPVRVKMKKKKIYIYIGKGVKK